MKIILKFMILTIWLNLLWGLESSVLVDPDDFITDDDYVFGDHSSETTSATTSTLFDDDANFETPENSDTEYHNVTVFRRLASFSLAGN